MEQMAAIGAFFKGVLPGAFGAAVSAFIRIKVVKDDASKLERIATFMFGIGIAHIVGGATIEHYSISFDSWTATAIKFAIGLFGMAILTQAYIQIPDTLIAIRKKYTGE